MTNHYLRGRLAAAMRSGGVPHIGPRPKPYAIGTYDTYGGFRVAMKRDFGVDVDQRFLRHVGTTRIPTGNCKELYIDNSGGRYKALVISGPMTDAERKEALRELRGR